MSPRSLLLAFFPAVVLAAGCSTAPSDTSTSGASSALAARSAMTTLLDARKPDSEAGTGLSDSEAHFLAWDICDSTDPKVPCQAPSPELVHALDDLAIQTRIGGTGWLTLQAHIATALGLAPVTQPATLTTWPALHGGSTEKAVPILALPNAGVKTARDALNALLAEQDSAVMGQSATAILDTAGKVLAYRLSIDLNSCNGCQDHLDAVIGVDGLVIEKAYLPDTGYCC